MKYCGYDLYYQFQLFLSLSLSISEHSTTLSEYAQPEYRYSILKQNSLDLLISENWSDLGSNWSTSKQYNNCFK